jgi:Tol biopolymer transport system component
METGEEREIVPEASLYTGTDWSPLGSLRWSPDGRSILCGGHKVGIHLIDIQTGDITTIVEFHPRIWIGGFACSPDGKRIFYMRQRTEKAGWPSSIMAHDLATGEEQELCPVGRLSGGPVVSPDGRKLAFPDGWEHIKIVPTAGGEAREFVSLHNIVRPLEADEIREGVSPVAWTPDGHYLLFKRSRRLPDGSPDNTSPPELWRIPAEGGEPQKLLTAEGLGKNLFFHPDGQRIAYCRATGGPEQNELWVMENLLPTFAADK